MRAHLPLLSRVAALVVLLAVPLALAVASQALAERPGRPDVRDRPVVVGSTENR